ncbi:hypothetical protein [Paenibacillus sp. PL2-23]|uniref:hypothetical protein n=1 Tax=Paenibacillus sp. PL2-23 TaxID=2100729 RepID=UPI0030F998D3
MDGKFSISFDGQEAQMIINALQEKADRMRTSQVAGMYRLLAKRVTEGKLSFHSSTYQIMAARYGLPIAEVSGNAISMEQLGSGASCHMHGSGAYTL